MILLGRKLRRRYGATLLVDDGEEPTNGELLVYQQSKNRKGYLVLCNELRFTEVKPKAATDKPVTMYPPD